MKPETRDNINLGVTIFGALLLPLGFGYFNSKLETQTATITAHSDSNLAALKQSITETYETQADENNDMQKMQDWNKSMAQGQRDLADKVDKNNVEQRLAIQHLGDKMDNLSSKQTINQNNGTPKYNE